MDPQQALLDLMISIQTNDRAATVDYLEALAGWISRDGLMPEMALALEQYDQWRKR